MGNRAIKIDLESDTASFIGKMDKAGRSIEDVGKHAEHAGGLMENFKKGFELAGGFEAFHQVVDGIKEGLDQVKDAFEQVGDIGRNAMKLGIGVEDMSRFQHAANATGVDISALTTGMDFLNRQIGLIASGDKSADKAANALKKLGLNAADLAQLDPSETFKRVSAALAGMHDHYQKAAIVQELLSRGGRELIPLMENLTGLFQDSDDTGFTRTAEDFERIEADEKNLANATDRLKGALMDLASSQDFQDWLAGWSQGVKNIVDDINALGGVQRNAQKDGDALADNYKKLADARKRASDPSDSKAQADAQKEVVELEKQRLKLTNDLETQAKNSGGKVQIHGHLQSQHDQRSQIHADTAALDALQKKMQAIDAEKVKFASSEKARADAATESTKRQDEAEKRTFDEISRLHDRIAADGGFADHIAQLKVEGVPQSAIDSLVKAHDALAKFTKQKEEADRGAELWKQSETAAQKYADALKEVNKLLADHALTAQQAAQIKQHLKDQYQKSLAKDAGGMDDDKPDRQRNAEAVNRNFDFRVPGTSAADPQREIAAGQKQALNFAAKWDTWFNQIWQKIVGETVTPNVLDL